MPTKVKATQPPRGEAPSKKVRVALEQAEHLPTSVRHMLSEALPHAIISSQGGPAERHSYQAEVLALVQEALLHMKEGAVLELKEREDGVREVREVLEEKKSGRDVLQQEEEAAKTHEREKASLLDEAKTDVERAQKENAEAQALKEAAVENAKQAVDSKAEVLALIDGAFKLEQDDLDAKSRHKQIDGMLAYLDQMKAEKVLLAALPAALAKGASERGPFDRITAESISEILQDKVAKQEQDLEKYTADKEEAESMALGTSAMLDTARDRLAEASATASEAQSAVGAASKALKPAQVKVAKQEQDLKKYIVDQDSARSRIEEIDSIRQVFERLVACEPEQEEVVEETMVTKDEVPVSAASTTKIASYEPELSMAPTLVGGA